MVEGAPKSTQFAVDLNPLVHGPPCDATFLFAEQPNLVVVCPRTVVDPPAEELVLAPDPETGLAGLAGQHDLDFRRQRPGDFFVGIDEKNPLPLGLVNGKLLLVREAGPPPVDHSGTQLGCDSHRAVFTESIDNDQLIDKPEASQAALDVALLVPRYDDRR
jgi:hypothetical protein